MRMASLVLQMLYPQRKGIICFPLVQRLSAVDMCYLPQECFNEHAPNPVTKEDDVYSMGVTIYELNHNVICTTGLLNSSQVLADEEPFYGYSPFSAGLVIMREKLGNPNFITFHGYTGELWKLTEDCWNADPVGRLTKTFEIQVSRWRPRENTSSWMYGMDGERQSAVAWRLGWNSPHIHVSRLGLRLVTKRTCSCVRSISSAFQQIRLTRFLQHVGYVFGFQFASCRGVSSITPCSRSISQCSTFTPLFDYASSYMPSCRYLLND